MFDGASGGWFCSHLISHHATTPQDEQQPELPQYNCYYYRSIITDYHPFRIEGFGLGHGK